MTRTQIGALGIVLGCLVCFAMSGCGRQATSGASTPNESTAPSLPEQAAQESASPQGEGEASPEVAAGEYIKSTDEQVIRRQLRALDKSHHSLIRSLKGDVPYARLEWQGLDLGDDMALAHRGDQFLEYAEFDDEWNVRVTYEALKTAGKEGAFAPYDFFIGKPFLLRDATRSRRVHIRSVALLMNTPMAVRSMSGDDMDVTPEDVEASGGEWRLVLLTDEELKGDWVYAEYEGNTLLEDAALEDEREEREALTPYERQGADEEIHEFEERLESDALELALQFAQEMDDTEDVEPAAQTLTKVGRQYLLFLHATVPSDCEEYGDSERNDASEEDSDTGEWDEEDCEGYTVTRAYHAQAPGDFERLELPFDSVNGETVELSFRHSWRDAHRDSTWMSLSDTEDAEYLLEFDGEKLEVELATWEDYSMLCDH